MSPQGPACVLCNLIFLPVWSSLRVQLGIFPPNLLKLSKKGLNLGRPWVKETALYYLIPQQHLPNPLSVGLPAMHRASGPEWSSDPQNPPKSWEGVVAWSREPLNI